MGKKAAPLSKSGSEGRGQYVTVDVADPGYY